MNYFLKYTFIVLLSSLYSEKILPQDDFYHDVFLGGVTSDGYNSFNLELSQNLNIYIEPGSVIRKAYLFATSWSVNNESVDERTIDFNGNLITFERSVNSTNSEFESFYYGSNFYTANILYSDVSSMISPLITSYYLTPPFNQDPTIFNGGLLGDFYLIVLYENDLLEKTAVSIFLNNKDAQQSLLASLNPVLVMDTSNIIGFSFNANSIGDTITDGSDVYIENNYIGTVGGNEIDESFWSGVRGSFYYQDATLYGLDNDIANNFMSGVDAIANINSYLNNRDSILIRFEYQTPGLFFDDSNPIHELFLAYTTPCDTFSVSVPSDTTICKDTQLQLNASGGQTYEWLPATGLSCNTCPNPIFTADSTMHYTVRIWNNDTCSVVRPIQILVSQPKIDNLVLTAPDCGANNGSVAVNASGFSWLNLEYNNGGAFQTDSIFSNLAAGNYTFTVQDEIGCTADTTLFLPAVNNTVAQFNTTAGSTEVPVTVWAENQSVFATNYEWYVDGSYFDNTLDILPVFSATGTHTIELIAWQYDPSCADTAYIEIIIADKVIVPTAFTPNGDGVNDFWEILYLDELYPKNKVFVYNRWGSLIYESDEGNYNGRPWDFEPSTDIELAEMPVGSYYFIIDLNDGEMEGIKGSVTVIR